MEPAAAPRPTRSPFDAPTPEAWPAVEAWNDRMERDWSAFVERLGAAVESRRCSHLAQCLRDPEANALYDAVTDARLRLGRVDCADLPYIVRGYYAFKRRLPFGFVSGVRATYGADARYALGVRPTRWNSWRDFRTPRQVLSAVVERVQSAMYRTPPAVEDGDFYPVAVRRGALRPGSIYYDPNGHVLLVARVRDDGAVYLIDGHPDGSVTWRRFGPSYAVGTARLGGGFKNFRPLQWNGRAISRARDAAIADVDARSQWDRSAWVVGGQPSTYHAWVRASLALPAARPDPERDFRESLRAACRDIADRVDAVELARAAGVAARPHPGYLPWNIYGTLGDWETWSSPSRDARLKVVFAELRDDVLAAPAGSPLRAALRRAWAEESARPECRFTYRDSRGEPVALSLDDVIDRLFAMSFDPYHCPELRWGAPEGSAERATCPDDPTKRGWYRLEQRLRNRVDRQYGVATPLSFGPEEAPDVDPRRALATGAR